MSETSESPALSVILPTPSDFASIAATVYHLGRQSVADRLELVVVAMGQPGFSLDQPACRDFWGSRFLNRHSDMLTILYFIRFETFSRTILELCKGTDCANFRPAPIHLVA
jgi:hypothetical protein